MHKLNAKQVSKLLELIKNSEDRKIVKRFLEDIKKSDSKKQMDVRFGILKTSSAKRALHVICKLGLEIGKHLAAEEILHLLD